MIASNGVAVENNRTLPYGQPWNPQIASASTKKYTTYERDSESNLDYAINRFMANTYGRFQSRDPVAISASMREPMSLNRYIYTGADPINLLDPTGEYDDSVGQAHWTPGL